MQYHLPKYIPADQDQLALEAAEALAVLNVRVKAGLIDTTVPEFEELIGLLKQFSRSI